MIDKPKFLHVAAHIHQNLFRDSFMIGGFYNWHLSFKGDFKLYNKGVESHLEDYDILFVGISRPELEGVMISQMRKIIGPNSKTKIVACIDYAIELWQNTFNPNMLENELNQADMIFTAEPMMKSWVEALIGNRRPVYHIPHPSNLDAIAQIAKPIESRSDEIAAIIHRYDQYWLPVYLVSKNLPWDTTAVLLDPSIEIQILPYFPFTKHGFQFTQYLDWISRKKICFDSYHRIHAYGRTAVDNASLMLPTVGTDWVWGQKYLWPDLTVPAGDVNGEIVLIKKLFNEPNFYLDCIEKAKEKVEIFSYENRVKDFLEKLNQ